jgi:hypothetical protein
MKSTRGDQKVWLNWTDCSDLPVTFFKRDEVMHMTATHVIFLQTKRIFDLVIMIIGQVG